MVLETNTYYSVNALAGSGKTHVALEWAVKFAHQAGGKFLFVQPSKALIDESYRKCRSFAEQAGANIKITKLYGEDGKTSVLGQITNHFRHAVPGGEIVLITQAAFFAEPYLHHSEDWVLIMDEIPQVDRHWGLKLPQTHRLLTEALAVSDHDPLHYRVRAVDRKTLEAFRQNSEDDQIYAMFSEAAECLLSDHWSVFVRKEHWHRYQEGCTDGGRYGLDLFALMEPSIFAGFKSVIVMGAMFDQSLLALYWASKGVEFQSRVAIESKVRYQQHDNGKLITFSYVLDDDWSKRIRNRQIDDKSLMDYVVDAVKAEFRDRSFLWIANRDVADDVFPTGIRLPNAPHGLNSYQDIDNVVFLSALNRVPVHYSFLDQQGLDSDWVKLATGCQTAYQAMMRCSARNPSSMTPKTIVVPDKRTAEFLTEVFPGCAIGPLGGVAQVPKLVPGKKPITGKALSQQQRQVRSRAEKKRVLVANLLVLASEQGCVTKPLLERECVTDFADGSSRIAEAWNAHTVSLFKSIYSAEPSMRLRLTNDELIEQLRECHTWLSTEKTANALISAAAFDPAKSSDTKRGIANIEYVNGIWLDNDDGDLTPDEFHRIHPDLKLVAFNTYSGGKRWRGFIPTTQAMTVEVHQLIMKTLISALHAAGYRSDKDAAKLEAQGKPVKRHGFDVSKFVASSLFYLPCLAKDGTGFFRILEGKEIDPIWWVENAVVHDVDEPKVAGSNPVPITSIPANSNQPQITWTGLNDCPFINPTYLGNYQSTQGHSGERYNGLFGMAMSILKGAERQAYPINEFELERLLTEIDDTMGQYHQQQDRTRIPQAARSALRKKAG